MYVTLTGEDKVSDTAKVTTGFFTGGVGTSNNATLTTASLADTQEEYYINLQYSNKDVFSVAYGHVDGSGSNDNVGQTKAIYGQHLNLLAGALEQEHYIGFQIKGSGSGAPNIGLRSEGCYFITAERAAMKDRLNRKNWTLQLSGSGGPAADGSASVTAGKTLHLTDDSNVTAATPTVAGPRYNIVSGALGVVSASGTALSANRYGWFYPNMGVMVLDEQRLSASLPGSVGYVNSGSTGIGAHESQGVGLAQDTRTTGAANNAAKLARSMMLGAQTFRNEEDQTTVSYFCRAKARQFNFSNNPSFTTGSLNELRNPDQEGNPITYITSVGLYDGESRCVAIGRLSTPIKKTFSTEAVIKVNLTY